MKWIDKKYEIIKSLGSGSFSDVFLVKGGEEEAALKLLKTEITMRPSEKTLACFKNEFSILKNLNHPNIAKILDFGLDSELLQYYFTSEYVKGVDIYAATEMRDVKYVIKLFVQALRALEYLHSYRVYHFDIKAANLLVTGGNALKLIDFGLASIDPKGSLLGTPSYMAPEIIMGEKPDGRADIYSLGVLWYYCLARKNPFRTGDPKATLSNHKLLVPPPVSNFNKDAPPYLCQIIARMLEKRPAMRYMQAAEIIKDLNLLGDLSVEMETRETILSYIPEKGRFIGRQREIAKIKDIITAIGKKDANHSIMLISGKKGTGKTRLLGEIKYYAQLNDLPVTTADGHDAAGVAAVLDRLGAHLKSGGHPQCFLIQNAEWLESNDAVIEKIKNALAQVPAYSENAPTLAAIGVDEESAVASQLESFSDAKVKLADFTPDELREYLLSVTGLSSIPEFLVEEISKRTGNNPLFVTELVKALVAGGSLFSSKGRWKEASFADLGVDFKHILPGSLKELLMGPYSYLPPAEKEILDVMSVVARPANLYELSSITGQRDIDKVIELLVRGDLIQREEKYDYYFRNPLLAGYIYEEMPKAAKEKAHTKIATFLAENEGNPDEIARHLGAGEDRRAAFAAAFEAGLRNLREGKGKNAIDYFLMAALQNEVLSVEEVSDLDLKLGEAYLLARDYKSALKYFSEASALLREKKAAISNTEWQVDTLIKIGGTYIKLREFDKARGSFVAAKELLGQLSGDKARGLIIENWEGYLALQEGRIDEAEKISRASREVWENLPPEQKPRVKNNELGLILLEKRDFDGAASVLSGDIDYFKGINDSITTALRYYNLAKTYEAMGDLSRARKNFVETERLSREIKDFALLLCAYNGLGNVCNMVGDFGKSREYYERAGALSLEMDDYKSNAAISINIGIIDNELGNLDQAYYAFSPAIAYLKNTSPKTLFDWQMLFHGELGMAQYHISRGMFSDAEEKLLGARDTLSHLAEYEGGYFWLLLTEARLSKERGDEAAFQEILPSLQTMAKSDVEKKALADMSGEGREKERVIVEEKAAEDEGSSSHLRHYQEMMDGSVHGFATKHRYEDIIGRSKPMADILQIIDKITDTDISVLITGESGTGKELIARALHFYGPRKDRQFVTVNCGAIPPALIESELFGYKAGAFTGAARDKKGLFEEADGGTIFLDEISELALPLQVKLLRVLQEGEFTRVGDTKMRKCDVRVIAATNKEIEKELAEKRFREDLYWRICQMKIHLPPLRERLEDIPLLVKYFLGKETSSKKVSPRFLKILMEYSWPGNIRELANLISVSNALSEGDMIDEKNIPSNHNIYKSVIGAAPAPPAAPQKIDGANYYRPSLAWRDYENRIIAKAYAAADFRVRPAARKLGLSPTTLYKKVEELGLNNRENPIYKDEFRYTPGNTLDSYKLPVFSAALDAASGRPKDAIKALKVSPGFFYKVMKRAR